jgi:hypothetical protein
MLPQDRRVDENATEQDITQRIQRKLAHLDAPPRPPAQARRVGWRLTAQQYGDLATDQAEIQPGAARPVAQFRDQMDNELVRARFDLSGERRYSLAEADEMLQRRFGDDLVLRTACKARLAALNLLSDDAGLTGRVPDPRILEARGQRTGDLRASAEEECHGAVTNSHPRTNNRGVLINAAGEPITLRSHPY